MLLFSLNLRYILIAVIIAGGAGTRLWPLSTKAKPKQFIKPIAGRGSLLEQMHAHIAPIAEEVFIVAPKQYEDLVQASGLAIPDENFIREPAPRGTAGAIFLALRHILKKHDRSTPLFFAWADHLIDDPERYRELILVAENGLKENLGLIKFGIKPTYPATNFGYIETGQPLTNSPNILNLKSFKEKPDLETAQQFLDAGGFLWNAGYFMTTAGYVIKELEAVNPAASSSLNKLVDTPDNRLEDVYLNLKNSPIEKELSEHLEHAYVVACDFHWADLGSFRDLHSHSQLDDEGNHKSGPVFSTDATASYLVNKTDVPLACVGVDNLAVVVTPDGILVADKDKVAEIGKLAKDIQESAGL